MSHCHTFIATLRARGHRLTPQREMIIEAVAHSDNHMTAEEIFALVHARSQAINLATVYRTLDFLVREGIVSQTDLGSGRVVFATTEHGTHIHLVCRQCGRVLEADAQLTTVLEQQCREQYGFVADLRHVSLPGLCAECQS